MALERVPFFVVSEPIWRVDVSNRISDVFKRDAFLGLVCMARTSPRPP